MMKKNLFVFVLLMSVLTGFAQTVTLTFTGRDANNNYCQLDKVVIVNQTQGWQETIYWPDTTLAMEVGTGIEDFANEGAFAFSQNNPNPFAGTTEAMLNVVETGDVFLELTDVNGRIIETKNFASLHPGNHQFQINVAAAGIYFLTARQNGHTSSIKMVNTGNGAMNKIEYQNFVDARNNNNNVETWRAASLPNNNAKNNAKGITTHPFALGDQMEYVGYATINEIETQSWPVEQEQDSSQIVTLSFAALPAPVPCPGAATVTDVDGNVYNTVQIGLQCWMKENLRTTRYADGTCITLDSTENIPVDFDVAYRYYPNNDSGTVATYGYLYNWNAVMGNESSSENNPSGVQGICPTGWHVPSDAEWAQLTSFVKSQPGYVCVGCDGNDGESAIFCIAKALASTTDWSASEEEFSPGNNLSSNNSTGFSVLPAASAPFASLYFGYASYFWTTTATDSDTVYFWYLLNQGSGVYKRDEDKYFGNSVRCLKN